MAASNALDGISNSNLQHLFYVIRLHEARGDVANALNTARSAKHLGQTPDKIDMVSIFSTAEAYFGCLSSGDWSSAIKAAMANLDLAAQTTGHGVLEV